MSLDDFITLHGGPTVMPPRGRLWLCKDGASIMDGPIMKPPPSESKHRLLERRRYHQTLLERAETDAAKLEAALRYPNAQPWSFPSDHDWFYAHISPPVRDGMVMLARLGAIVERERKAVVELDAVLGPPVFA